MKEKEKNTSQAYEPLHRAESCWRVTDVQKYNIKILYKNKIYLKYNIIIKTHFIFKRLFKDEHKFMNVNNAKTTNEIKKRK